LQHISELLTQAVNYVPALSGSYWLLNFEACEVPVHYRVQKFNVASLRHSLEVQLGFRTLGLNDKLRSMPLFWVGLSFNRLRYSLPEYVVSSFHVVFRQLLTRDLKYSAFWSLGRGDWVIPNRNKVYSPARNIHVWSISMLF
jgi:hypothetical protein